MDGNVKFTNLIYDIQVLLRENVIIKAAQTLPLKDESPPVSAENSGTAW